MAVTLDEAIRHCYEVYYERDDMCKECREEHRQLAQWLEELKESRETINRLKAENDDLFFKLQGVMWSVDKWLDSEELKQDEVNRAITMREKTLKIVEELQRNYDAREGVVNTYDKELKRRKEEIERLEQIIKDSHSICEDCKEKYAEEFEDAKTEARKEFWERLIKKAEIVGGGDYGFTYEIKEDDITDLLKEMENN